MNFHDERDNLPGKLSVSQSGRLTGADGRTALNRH